MNTEQLLKQIVTNRELIRHNNQHAHEALHMLKNNYPHLVNEEIALNLGLNESLAELHFKSNYRGAIDNSVAVLDKYKNSPHHIVAALHLKTIGSCYAHIGEFDLAERYLFEALDTVQPDDPEYITGRSDILHALAMNQELKEEGHPATIKYLTEAIQLLHEPRHAVRQANCLMGLGNVYINMEKVEDALKYYNRAAETFERSYMLANMASAYCNIGTCHIKLREFERAERYLKKSLELRLKCGSPDEISISYFNLAIVHKERREFDEAEEYLVKTKQILEEVGNQPYINYVNDMMNDLAYLRRGAVRGQ